MRKKIRNSPIFDYFDGSKDTKWVLITNGKKVA